jgi:phage-related protein
VRLAAFHPKARDVIRTFPTDVRRELGKAIFDLQAGVNLTMPLSRSMPSVAVGVSELRLRDRSGIYRVFYYTKVADLVLIFHAFTKKT